MNILKEVPLYSDQEMVNPIDEIKILVIKMDLMKINSVILEKSNVNT